MPRGVYKHHENQLFQKGHKINNGKVPWNKGLTKETSSIIDEYSKKVSNTHKCNHHTPPKETQFCKGNVPWDKGIKRPEISGENHWNWQGGKSLKGYPKEFNDELKAYVKEKNNYTCQRCGVRECELTGFHKTLVVHHIDYDKKNNHLDNLVTLCRRCNIIVNYDKAFYYGIF